MSIPEYLKYFDYHISLKIIEFHVNSKLFFQEITSIKTSKLFSTLLFDEQEAFLKSNKFENASLEQIKEKKEFIAKKEEELKRNVADFLQLADSCRSQNDYDTSTSYRKKIVRSLLILDR